MSARTSGGYGSLNAPTAAHRRKLRVQSPPRAAIRPYPLTPSISYPTPMPTHARPPAIVVLAKAREPRRFPAPPTLPPQRRQVWVQGSPCPLQGVGAGLALLVLHPPFSAHFPICAAPPGCSLVVSRPIRVIAAPRGSDPRSWFNLQAATRPRRQNHGSNPSSAQPRRDTTSIQPQSCTEPLRARERRSQARRREEKRVGTNRIDSNRRARPARFTPHAPLVYAWAKPA